MVLGGSPTVNELVGSENVRSISKPSYLDMPTVNSIASVYQSKILKDAMRFHHAAFNNCAKSTLLAEASKGIIPLWPPYDTSQHLKICNRNTGNPHGSHAESTSKPEVDQKRGATAPAKTRNRRH